MREEAAETKAIPERLKEPLLKAFGEKEAAPAEAKKGAEAKREKLPEEKYTKVGTLVHDVEGPPTRVDRVHGHVVAAAAAGPQLAVRGAGDAVELQLRQPGLGAGAQDALVHLQQGADFYASLRTQAALEKAEVAVVLLDVSQPISEQDVRIIDLVLESGRALVLAYNKWDLLDDDRRRYLEREIEQDLAHVTWAPRVNISARTGRHLEKLVPALELALDSWDTRIPTGKFNALIAELTAEHPHPVRGGKQPRILFGTQASTRPPTFVLFTTGFLDPGYRRFIQRRLRELYGFEGSPIVVNMRVREKKQR